MRVLKRVSDMSDIANRHCVIVAHIVAHPPIVGIFSGLALGWFSGIADPRSGAIERE